MILRRRTERAAPSIFTSRATLKSPEQSLGRPHRHRESRPPLETACFFMESFASPPAASSSSSGMFTGQASDSTVSDASLSMTMGMPTPSGSDLPPLPSISPPSSAFISSPFQAGQSPSPTWSPQEMQTLLAGLTEFPPDQFDPVTRYIKIAAMIPGKCVRDVALQSKAVTACGSSSNETTQWLSSQFPSPARAAKRMKIEPFGGQNQTVRVCSVTSWGRFTSLTPMWIAGCVRHDAANTDDGHGGW